MRFTVIGHSSLYMESNRAALLVDPWLFGSCYWRSWWHFPPIGDIDDVWLEPDYVYLTHHHFDHFHFPSLRRIDKRTTVLIPRFAIDFMAGELKQLGFRNVEEVDHGRTLTLAQEFKLTSYQYGLDDSALIVEDNTAMLANLNDCKIRGRALRQILTRHGAPTFLLKNHSWAQSYPHRYTSPDPADLRLLKREQYLADFVQTVHEARPAFAIPFASNVCFLHPQTEQFNAIAITPFDVADAFGTAETGETQLVVMGPRDSWSPETGFDVADWREYFEHRFRHIEELATAASEHIEKSLAEESRRCLRFEAFRAHFEAFLQALPPGAPFVLKKPVVFDVPSDDSPYWVLDFKTRRVSREPRLPSDYASLIRIDEGLLADAMEKNIVGMLGISMRLSVSLTAGGVDVDLMFWGCLNIWELGYLPVRRMLNWRTLDVAFRRRREFAETFGMKLIGRGRLVERLASRLMTDETVEG